MNRYAAVLVILACCLSLAAGKVYYKEEFGDSKWSDRWVVSQHKSDYGAWKWSAGDFYGDAKADKGLMTGQDARFYAIANKIKTPFSNEGKDLVVQFQVKHQQNIDCGGGYLKVMPADFDPEEFNGDSKYFIMFGPDICGSTKRIHAIFNYNGDNHLHKKNTRAESDQLSHVYTLHVKKDRTYEILVDGEVRDSGEIIEDWDVLPPRKIKDPSASKPSDWVDEEEIADPKDKKPSDWDDQPAKIPDPDAEKPDDWDDEDDGEWEAPMIDNPKYKGEWKPKMIPNPDYKGPWVHPEIDNPEFVDDESLHVYDNIGYVGFDLWQVKSGTVFDNIIITDSLDEAKDFMDETFGKNKDAEKKMFDKQDEARKAKEEESRKQAEAERKAMESDDDDDEDDAADEDEDDDEDAKAEARRKKLEALKEKAKKKKGGKDEL
eukprot:GFYU01000363.1.p2 GENE.GFYU01000363.1~~GFYU01000363.1.p2  ORF type:complete len:433 (-),score=213.71 GFYU01000363.1:298-1596(-)